jgi:succinate-semialdehyde dehydrogenase/glutarate-semialdehyde dehydrogenase
MLVMREEPFAPVAPIASFSTLEDGLRAANATRFGLAAYVFTENTRTAFQAAEGIEAGMVGVNHLGLATAEAPFGGIKESGYGREGGSEGVEAYTTVKYVNLKL